MCRRVLVIRSLALLAAVLVIGLAVAACSSPDPAPPPVPVPTFDTAQVAAPTRIEVPTIGAAGDLVALGLNPDGTLAVPPVDDPLTPSWYDRGPRPGAPGPAVISGHINGVIDGEGGQSGVFSRLGDLQPGDPVTVGRTDGTTATFTVTRVEEYAKDRFPTAEVYGDTTGATLRLISCGGSFDPAARSYEDNIVAYATQDEGS